MTRPPLCTLGHCRWPATHTVDTNQPPYAGPRLVCAEHMHAAIDAIEHPQQITVGGLPREDTPA